MDRRQFIKLGGASLLMLSSPFAALGKQASTSNKSANFIWVILRGGLDSLHTVVPKFDPDLAFHRPNLLSDINKQLLPISQGYALHPSLKQFHQLFEEQQLLPIVAVSSGYKKRSHFDAQDFMESGTGSLDLTTGWLARATTQTGSSGVAIAKTLPLTTRGNNNISTWYPTRLKAEDQDIYQSVLNMYEYEPSFAENLTLGLTQRERANLGKQAHKGKFIELAKACGNLMKTDNNLNTAVLELGGWDTHNRQSPRLKTKLSELDRGIATLKQGLGAQWHNTVVAISTEFGRTVKENGTRGTDHGTASVMFLAGGAVKGGQVVGDWPGLHNSKLYQERDLTATSNMFDWLATTLTQHWQLSSEQTKQVFPTSKILQQQLLRNS